MDVKARDAEYIASTYKRFPVELVGGNGAELIDSEGKKYIDMGSGIAVNTFGVNDEEWKNAVIAQLNKISHASNLYYTAPQTELAEMLCKRTGMKRVFFGNSGAEANECAIKVARKYASDKYGEMARPMIVTLVNSFHGRTITTLAATGQDVFHHNFGPFTAGFLHVPANDIEAMRDALLYHPVCGVMLEMVQGEGGVLPLEKEYVQAVAKICEEKDIILIADEVQTGNGRTGTLFAYEQFGIQPDVVSTAKGLGGGLPLGACLMGEKVKDTLGPSSHGSTFGGNPVATAGAVSVISRLDEPFLAEVQRKSEKLIKGLTAIKGVKSVSGMGLMLGIETDKPAGEIIAECMKRGVLPLTAKTKVRLLPPLVITDEQIETALSVLKEVIEA